MKNDKLHENDEIEENPVTYYLNHIGNQKIMERLRWEDITLYKLVQRLHFLKSFQNTEPIYNCPECGDDICEDEWGEEYCPRCGLITRSHSTYVAGRKFKLPFGLKL